MSGNTSKYSYKGWSFLWEILPCVNCFRVRYHGYCFYGLSRNKNAEAIFTIMSYSSVTIYLGFWYMIWSRATVRKQ